LFAEVAIADATGVPDVEPEPQDAGNSQTEAAAEPERENSQNGVSAEQNESANELQGLKPDTLL